jgi:hypothetical protein
MVVLEEALHMTIVSKVRILEIVDITVIAITFILERDKAHTGL